MRCVLIPLCAAGAAFAPAPAAAEAEGEESEKTTRLEELVVTAPASPTRVTPPEVVLGSEALLLQQPRTLDEALNGLPGVMVRTNSRGEAVARVRGAEERQTQVFLDGAPASVPWDGRFDMSFLPAPLIGEITVVKGGAPIEYGANTVAGVVDLHTRRGAADGSGLTALAEGGSHGYFSGAAVGTWASDRYEATAAAGYLSRDAFALSDPSAAPFSQPDDDARTNTDLDAWTLFGAAGGELGGLRARVSLLHVDAERGIAPEGHVDPAPRYWRYPDWRLTQATLNAEADLGPVRVRGVGWGQWFGQTIDAYSDVTYTTVRSREVDDDTTWGGRATATHALGRGEARWSAMAQTSAHDQLDITLPAGTVLDRSFRQDLFSLGVEADQPLGETLQATVGAAYDRATNPRTGDKPPQAPMDAWAGSAALRWRAAPGVTVSAIVAQRTRFPSARELFGEALGRFAPNPDLRPETALLGDLVVDWVTPRVTLSVNPFVVDSRDTISQRVVSMGGVSRRQRFNLEGSTGAGVDAVLQARLTPRLTAELGATFLDAHASEADGGQRLVQRPDHELDAALAWQDERFSARAELRRIGPAVDLGPDGGEVDLPSATEINLAGAIVVARPAGLGRIEVTGAIDNLTDEVILPQIGLPAPGRTIRVGVRLRPA
jgi:iron complex outermembrane receptor protein